ncbi:SWIB/MDM2 domain-containing protein [Herbaspirillum sp. B65]|uniref:SWIB/MDM2 domain-containing protein n=1 Tax=Herbaspirillum sp. B65 TaxID=137708 RepID=UPI000A01A14D|nr:SWIB/MDM2 domain-containing protein [Herbaspirillum sp. B65]
MATAKKAAAAVKKPAAKPAAKAAAKPAAKPAAKAAAKPASKAAAPKAAAKPAAKPAAKAAPKAAPKKGAAKPAAKPAAKRTPNAAFMKPLTPSAALGEVVGTKPLPRTEVTKKVWEYIKKHKLQNAENKRNIDADDKLKAIFGGKKQVTMFEMTKLISAHLS